MATLKEQHGSGLQEDWILCVDKDGTKFKKRPMVWCHDCDEFKSKKCESYKHFDDAIDTAYYQAKIKLEEGDTEYVDGWNNFVVGMGERYKMDISKYVIGDNVPGKDAKTDKAPVAEEATEKETAKSDLKKDTKKTKKQKPGPKPGSKRSPGAEKPGPKPTKPEETASHEVPGEGAAVIMKSNDLFVVVPIHLDKNGIRQNLVDADKLEELTGKFEAEGIEYSVYKLGPDLKQKKQFDYLVIPAEEQSPIMIDKNDLEAAIMEFAENDINVRIFALGRELRYKKQIIIEEIED